MTKHPLSPPADEELRGYEGPDLEANRPPHCPPVPPAGILREVGTHTVLVPSMTPHQRLWLHNNTDALDFTMELTRLGADMTVFPPLPSISHQLLVFWPIEAPTHFLSLSQIPLSFQKSCSHSRVVRYVDGPVAPVHGAQSTRSCTVHICFWLHWVFVAQAFSPGGVQISHRSGSLLPLSGSRAQASVVMLLLGAWVSQDQDQTVSLRWQADSNLWPPGRPLVYTTWSDA